MKATLTQLAADVRRVWSPPAGRAWSLADLAMVKLLKAIEEAPPDRLPALAHSVFDALDGLDPEGAPAEILERALREAGFSEDPR